MTERETTRPARGSRRAPAAEMKRLLARGIALAAHASGVGLIVASLPLAGPTHAAVGRAPPAARRRADGGARAGRAGGRADRRAQCRASERAEGGADAHALGSVRRRVVAGLLLRPALAGA